MRNFKMLALVPAAILAVACGQSDNKKVDDALNSDLTLAAQARPFTAMDSISAAERAYAAQGLAPVGYAPAVAPAPTKTRVVYRDRPVYRSSVQRWRSYAQQLQPLADFLERHGIDCS